jgi:hypothetical protein
MQCCRQLSPPVPWVQRRGVLAAATDGRLASAASGVVAADAATSEIAVLVLGEVAAWLALCLRFAPIETTLILLGINLIIALPFGFRWWRHTSCWLRVQRGESAQSVSDHLRHHQLTGELSASAFPAPPMWAGLRRGEFSGQIARKTTYKGAVPLIGGRSRCSERAASLS